MFFGRRHKQDQAIKIDDDGVRRNLGRGRVEQVRWAELAEIRVVTTDDGPFSEDVFFVLVDRSGAGCVVPQELAQEGFLQRLQEHPGFDNEALVEAMGETGRMDRLLWRAGPPDLA